MDSHRLFLAFDAPYLAPLQRHELAVLLALCYDETAPDKGEYPSLYATLWDRLLEIAETAFLPQLRHRFLGLSDELLGTMHREFEEQRRVLQEHLGIERWGWFASSPQSDNQLPWPMVVEGLLEAKQAFKFSGKPRDPDFLLFPVWPEALLARTIHSLEELRAAGETAGAKAWTRRSCAWLLRTLVVLVHALDRLAEAQRFLDAWRESNKGEDQEDHCRAMALAIAHVHFLLQGAPDGQARSQAAGLIDTHLQLPFGERIKTWCGMLRTMLLDDLKVLGEGKAPEAPVSPANASALAWALGQLDSSAEASGLRQQLEETVAGGLVNDQESFCSFQLGHRGVIGRTRKTMYREVLKGRQTLEKKVLQVLMDLGGLFHKLHSAAGAKLAERLAHADEESRKRMGLVNELLDRTLLALEAPLPADPANTESMDKLLEWASTATERGITLLTQKGLAATEIRRIVRRNEATLLAILEDFCALLGLGCPDSGAGSRSLRDEDGVPPHEEGDKNDDE